MSSSSVAQRLERLPITSYQQTIFAVIATAWFFDCLDVAMMTFVLSSIKAEFSLTAAQAGTLGSMSFIGMFLGAGAAGILADKFGRVVVFRASIIIWGLASLACAYAPTVEALMAFRIFLGIGLAMELPVGQSMLCEFVPAKVRGRYVAMLEGMWPVGFMAAGILAMFIVPIWGWRGAFIAEAIPAIFVLVVRRMVPESPRWLSESGQEEKAREVVAVIENKVRECLVRKGKSVDFMTETAVAHGGGGDDHSEKRSAVAVLEREEDKPSSEKPSSEHPSFEETGARVEKARHKFSVSVIFEGEYRKRTIMVWSLWFFALLGYYGLTTWLGTLLEAKGISFEKSTEYIIQISAAGIPGFFTAAWLVEAWGRKPMMIVTLICSAIAAYFYGTADNTAVMIACGLTMQFFLFGMWSVLYAYTPELYPTHARATGAGMASSFGRLGALLGPTLVGIILPVAGQTGVFAMGAAALIAGALTVAILGEETKGKVLEEI